MTVAMRAVALVLVCVLAGPAHARAEELDTPPSPTLERAIKLYDRNDFFAAAIELAIVTSGESGDDARNLQRAELFKAKTYYQLGFFAASLAQAAAIVKSPGHAYWVALPRWLLALARVAPNPAVRAALFAYRASPVIDDPINANVRDEFAFELGRELGERGLPAEAIVVLDQVSPGSSVAARAQLEAARIELRGGDLDRGIARALAAARTPANAAEATRLIATWTRARDASAQARAPLAKLAQTHAYARYQHSRAVLDGRPELPGIAHVPVDVFDAVMLPSACRGRMPDDVKSIARQVAGEAKTVADKLLAISDPDALVAAVRRLQRRPSAPGTDVVLVMLDDRELNERIAWADELDRELQMLRTTAPGWQATQAAAEILEELTVLQSLAKADIGAIARQRISALARGLVPLDQMLRAASPAFPLSAGPDGLLHVEPELCRRGGTTPAAVAPVPKPTSGCAGCASHEPGWAIVLVVLVGLRRRARAR